MRQMKLKDQRMKLINEVLNGMKVRTPLNVLMLLVITFSEITLTSGLMLDTVTD